MSSFVAISCSNNPKFDDPCQHFVCVDEFDRICELVVPLRFFNEIDAVFKSRFYSEGNCVVMILNSIIHRFGFWLNDNVGLAQQMLAFDSDGLANNLRMFSSAMMDGLRFFKLTITMPTIRLGRIQ
jgi:hypothetical protein